jgi:glycosyltransferase involved in cell wall biosynthesis
MLAKLNNIKPEILCITSYPPRECGIATFSQDLIKMLKTKFDQSLSIKICALESENEKHPYPSEVKYILDTSKRDEYLEIAKRINNDANISIVLIQHEFGFFHDHEESFLELLIELRKPIVLSFHTVLPHPTNVARKNVQKMALCSASIIVMTNNSASILINEYAIPKDKIVVIPHGTHLIHHYNKRFLKEEYGLSGKRVLSTFGLLSAGKGIESSIDALPAIIREHPNVIFLVLGKTHPEVMKVEGERYRDMLIAKVETMGLQKHVHFVNHYLSLNDLLKYLQLTDIYLFTSKDPNQAVSGTFAYAMSCACPIISTPIPHALEVLTPEIGVVIDFERPDQLSDAVNRLLSNDVLRRKMSINTLHYIVSTVWENSSYAHARLFERIGNGAIILEYNLPKIDLSHLRKLTTDFGIIRYSNINLPDKESGYTLDDNARALVAFSQHYELTFDKDDLSFIEIYLGFIRHCLQPDGSFYNYVDAKRGFSRQNQIRNCEDSKGRALWALGHLISKHTVFPKDIIDAAENIFEEALSCISILHSYHAMSFTIKGLYYYNRKNKSLLNKSIIKVFANQLVQFQKNEQVANCILSEALLLAYLEINDSVYKKAALESFELALSTESVTPMQHAERIMATSVFNEVFREKAYFDRMQKEFNWFLGENRLSQIIYNPRTGGCFDGLEATHVNLNQGAESTIGYLMARLSIEKHLLEQEKQALVFKEAHIDQTIQLNNRALIVYKGLHNKPSIS